MDLRGALPCLLVSLLCCQHAALAGVPVLTRSYDNARTGAQTSETWLTPANVGRLQRLFSLDFTTDDHRLEAMPLYVPGLTLDDGKQHDVVYVCTIGNNVWAFDANDGKKLWSTATPLGKPIQGSPNIDMYKINDLWGVLSTPVIDLDTKTLYVVSWSLLSGASHDDVIPKDSAALNNTQHRLYAIDLIDGSQRKPPLLLAAQSAAATPAAQFDSHRQKQRAALLLAPLRQTAGAAVKKTLFIACGQFGEHSPGRHGWLLAVDVDAFVQSAAWCSTPTDGGGGIWHAGQGPSSDEDNKVYVMTSNGSWDGKTDLAESFVKLAYTSPPAPGAPGQLTVEDWFTPFQDKNRAKEPGTGYDFKDQDLGSAGPIVPPGLNVVLGGGKDGILYVLDRSRFGFDRLDKLKQPPSIFTYTRNDGVSASDQTGKLDRNFGGKTRHLHGSPLFWNSPDKGSLLYVWGENDHLRAWTLDAAGRTSLLAAGEDTASAGCCPGNSLGGMPGGMLTLSANGSVPNTGVVWSIAPVSGDANKQHTEGVLRAYDATQLDGTPNADGTPRLKKLWDSKTMAGNPTFTFCKFGTPVVADGKVLIPTYDGRIDVYGVP